MSHTMSLAVPTALRATYDQLATLSPAVAQRYVDVATVVQPVFTPTEFAIWTQHCLQLHRVAGGPGRVLTLSCGSVRFCSSAWLSMISGPGPSTAWR